MKITLTENLKRLFSFFKVFRAFDSFESLLQGRKVLVVKCHVVDLK